MKALDITSNSAGRSFFVGAADPHLLATAYLKQHGYDSHGHLALRQWRDEFWRFHEGRYRKVTRSELQAKVTEFVRQEFLRTKPTNKARQLLQVTRNVVSNVLLALSGVVLVEDHVEQPAWLSGRESEAGPFFVFTNGRVRVDDLLAGRPARLRSHCANWFTQTVFPYDFNAGAGCPLWLAFLNEVLEGDAERIALLQQWFGYCLTNDTTQQQFVVAVGQGQNGKSVALDVLSGLLGPENVSHVRVELFAQRFQLTMTLGKLANISYDTGRIDESAEATIKEFTGGDRMYFDRKGVPGAVCVSVGSVDPGDQRRASVRRPEQGNLATDDRHSVSGVDSEGSSKSATRLTVEGGTAGNLQLGH